MSEPKQNAAVKNSVSRRQFLHATASSTAISLSAMPMIAWPAGIVTTTQPGAALEQSKQVVWLNDRPVTAIDDCVGKWIWADADRNPRHFFLFARAATLMGEAPTAARLHISAEDRYLLYVNGGYVGRGPARSYPKLRSYDTYDVAAHLKRGKNVIAVRAYHYGIRLPEEKHNYCSAARAGVWCQLEYLSSDGKKNVLGTSGEWRMKAADGWDRTAGRINPCHGFTEIRDGRLDSDDWMAADYDDSLWRRAIIISKDESPWENMEARYTPLLREIELLPVELVKTGEVLQKTRDVELTELLVTETHMPAKHVEVKNADALLKPEKADTIVRSGSDGGSTFDPIILVDFGRQLFGFPRVELAASAGVTIDMTYGQSLLDNRIAAVTPRFGRWGDRYITREGKQSWEVAEYKQFRYLQLAVRGAKDAVRINSIACNQYGYPAPQRGEFECSDPLLNKLWQAGVDTAYLEMEDVLVCDAWRERNCHVDVPDPHGSVQATYVGFGDIAATDRKLLLTLQNVYADGQVRMKFWPEPRSQVYTNLTMLWSSSIREHYLYTGRGEVLKKVYPTMRTLVDWYEPHLHKDNLLHELPGGRTFVDWAPLDLRPPSFVINARYVKSLEDAAWVASEIGQSDDARRWLNIAEKIRETLRELYWSDAEGAFRDSFKTGSLAGMSELANGVALQVRIANESQAIKIGDAFRSGVEMVEATPLAIGHVAEGLFMSDQAQQALNLLRNRFRQMMNSAQYPTIWETWDPYDEYNRVLHIGGAHVALDHAEAKAHPGRSLAHGGGAMVSKVLTNNVLGVVPIAPKFSKCQIVPKPGDLKWARGIVPTPHGEIRVEWHMDSDGLKLKVELPPGVAREERA